MSLGACLISLLVAQSTPDAGPPRGAHLAIGKVSEFGKRVAGHGPLVAESVAFGLQVTGAYDLVARNATKDAALKKAFEVNSSATSDAQWIEVGKAVGATHLLVGEVRQSATGCTAYLEVVELESHKTRVSRPEIYDCTEAGVVDLAPELAFQLSGRKVPGDLARKAPRIPSSALKPVLIEVEGEQGRVDGKKIPLEKTKPAPVVVSPPTQPDSRTAVPDVVTPPEPPVRPRVEVPQPPAPQADAFDLVRDLSSRHGALIAWLHVLIPVAFFALALLWKGTSPSVAGHLLGLPIGLTFVSTGIWALSLGLLATADNRQILTELQGTVVLAPPLAFLGSVVLARIVMPLGDVWVFRQIRRLVLFAISGAFAVLWATSPTTPVWVLAGLGVLFAVVFATGLSRSKKDDV